MRGRKLRWLLALAGLAVLLAVGALLPRSRPPPVRVTYEHTFGFRYGMTLAEVESILGGPPDDYRTRPNQFDSGPVPQRVPVRDPLGTGDSACIWATDEVNLTVVFDSTGRVRDWAYTPVIEAPRSTSGDLLWRAKRQWRRWFP
jgi:hypothetical protein